LETIMLTRSPLEIEMNAEMRAAELERTLRNRRPEWYGGSPLEGPRIRRGAGRVLVAAGTWISGSRER
jgi:hypothetical protein